MNDEKSAREWKAKIKREDLPKIARRCEKHFEESSFDPHVDLKNRLLPAGTSSFSFSLTFD